MEPTQRKMKILEAVVEAFIRTGEPVGSKALCDALDFTVSSATIRNDMADLAALGLLEQPHTCRDVSLPNSVTESILTN